jgi:hypothetical protein
LVDRWNAKRRGKLREQKWVDGEDDLGVEIAGGVLVMSRTLNTVSFGLGEQKKIGTTMKWNGFSRSQEAMAWL